jgi:phosphate transport system permease protein
VPEDERRLNDKQLAWIERWKRKRSKNGSTDLFHRRRFPGTRAGRHLGAVMGSFYTLVVTLLLSFPIGVAAAVYLEEFAPKNRWTDLIEVNINNLAAVPSIVFGLLGLAVFLNFFGCRARRRWWAAWC